MLHADQLLNSYIRHVIHLIKPMNPRLILGLFLLIYHLLPAQINFDEYFLDKQLRLDYIHAGDASHEHYFFDELIEEPYWGGSRINLIDTLRYGQYFFEVVELTSGKIIYSRGYSTLFHEWQTTEEASRTRKAFTESVIFPYPRKNVRVDFYSRNRKGIFEKKFEYTVDVQSPFIRKERRMQHLPFDVHISAPSHQAVDIVLLPEGYTFDQLEKFFTDCQIFAAQLFSFEPFKSNQHRFNIRGIVAPSPEAGCDNPSANQWVRTLLDASFYTFGTERYCMTSDFKAVRDLAANAPYDQIYILVNHEKFGGGAIYNYYSLSVTSNQSFGKILVHEFGHAFAGLGDEYYTSEVAYVDFYPTDVEPWEPNLTTLVNFESKWKNLLAPSTPIPTPASQAYEHVVGVFEGGGYSAKGVYRPMIDCLMHTFRGAHFCPVCTRAIEQMINFYSQ